MAERSVTIASIEMVGGDWQMVWDREAGERRYTYRVRLEPRKLVGGQSLPLEPAELALVISEGLPTELRVDAEHQDAADGSGPTAQTIANEQLSLIAAAYQDLVVGWVGQRVYRGREAVTP